MALLFDDLVDGSARLYFDDLGAAPGVFAATCNATVEAGASAAGVTVASCLATVLEQSSAQGPPSVVNGSANASVTISAANDPNETYLLFTGPRAVVEIDAFVAVSKVGIAASSVVIACTAAAVTPRGQAGAAVSVNCSASGTTLGIASSSVTISATAAGASEDLSTSPARASITLNAVASPRLLSQAFATVSIGAQATGFNIVTGVASASVTITAQAFEAAGVRTFPQSVSTVSIGARAFASVVAAPVRGAIPVTGKSIDWKTIADFYNAQEPPVAEYEFGSGKNRRTFKQTGS